MAEWALNRHLMEMKKPGLRMLSEALGHPVEDGKKEEMAEHIVVRVGAQPSPPETHKHTRTHEHTQTHTP